MLALRPSALPNIASAALPASYERAKTALATCIAIDECKDWADRMAALASYAKQAEDQSLHHFAVRISSRAIRRCGELLEQFQTTAKGGRPKENGEGTRPVSQREAAAAAGLSEHQEKQAVRVANVPAADFEALVESADPPTVTALAEMGTTKQVKVVPEKFSEATHILGILHALALFCAEHPPALVGQAVMPHEVQGFRADVDAMHAWWTECLRHVPEGTC